MPLYDYECTICGKTTESIQSVAQSCIKCECGAVAKRIISCSGHFTANEDTGWLKTVPEVIDRDTKNPVAKEFVKNPTRSNYKAWMKSEGIRPMERNEPTKPPPADLSRVRKRVWEKHQRRNRIEI